MEATLTFTVTDEDTAAALGSGSLPVLGTPRLLAWCVLQLVSLQRQPHQIPDGARASREGLARGTQNPRTR